jgi:hypothetical protein
VLERAAGTAPAYGPWYQRYGLGIASIAVGTAALIAAFWIQFGGHRPITQVPNLSVTIPLLLVTVGCGVGAFLRHERLRGLPIAGMSMAAAAVALGWVVVLCIVGIVAASALLVIAKLH